MNFLSDTQKRGKKEEEEEEAHSPPTLVSVAQGTFTDAVACPAEIGGKEIRTPWNGQLFAKQVMPFVDMTVKGWTWSWAGPHWPIWSDATFELKKRGPSLAPPLPAHMLTHG